MDSWKLREALFLSLSQWYQVLAFILIGAVIGFGFASLTPRLLTGQPGICIWGSTSAV